MSMLALIGAHVFVWCIELNNLGHFLGAHNFLEHVDTAKVSESLSLQRVEVTVMVIDCYGGGGRPAVR
jgi:hypothetical protein